MRVLFRLAAAELFDLLSRALLNQTLRDISEERVLLAGSSLRELFQSDLNLVTTVDCDRG